MNDESKNSVSNPAWFETLDSWIGRIREDLELAMTALIEKSVNIEVEPARLYKENHVDILFQNGPVVITIRFSAKEIGAWHILLPRPLAGIIAELSVSGDPSIPFDESSHTETLREIWGQIMSALELELSALAAGELTVFTPEVSTDPSIALARLNACPAVKWKLDIEDIGEQVFLSIIDPEFSVLFGVDQAQGSTPVSRSGKKNMGNRKNDADDKERLSAELERLGFGESEGGSKVKPTVKRPVFEDFGEPIKKTVPSGGKPRNLDMLLDINLPIVIELGRTQMLVKDILELGPGSVIELNKLSGEPVDLFVNDKKFARGEVVVIEENFGIRITELIKLDERIKILG